MSPALQLSAVPEGWLPKLDPATVTVGAAGVPVKVTLEMLVVDGKLAVTVSETPATVTSIWSLFLIGL